MHDEHEHHEDGQENFEPTDAHVGPILALGAILVVGTAVSFFAGYILLKYSTERAPATAYEPSPLITERQTWQPDNGVRLQIDLASDFHEYERTASPVPHSYGVLSEEPEIYHFPVEVAIDYIADHGFPEFKPFGDGSLEADPGN